MRARSAHCFERSFFHSMLYVYDHLTSASHLTLTPLISVWDFGLLALFLWTALTYIPKINPSNIDLPHPALYKAARFLAWVVYDFVAGMVGTGIWVIAHECGHQAFSTSKAANNTVGWILHSL